MFEKKCTVTKSFEFDYGHRVHTQNVNQVLSGSNENSCRRLHGHRGKFNITFEGPVNEQGLVIDFKNLDYIKRFINTFYDHKFILSKDDPLISNKLISLKKSKGSKSENINIITSDMVLNIATSEKISLNPSAIKSNRISTFENLYDYVYKVYRITKDYFVISILENDDDYVNEWNTSFTISNFIPTAENFSASMYHWLQRSLEMYLSNKIKINTKDLRVKKVEFFETPTSSSVYEG